MVSTPPHGGMAEWLKAAVLKTVVRKYRGFESYSLRHGHTQFRRDDRVGRWCSPAKRVWGLYSTEGSNPSLSAILDRVAPSRTEPAASLSRQAPRLCSGLRTVSRSPFPPTPGIPPHVLAGYHTPRAPRKQKNSQKRQHCSCPLSNRRDADLFFGQPFSTVCRLSRKPAGRSCLGMVASNEGVCAAI